MVILRFAILRIYEVIQHIRFLGNLHGGIGKDDSILSDDASRSMVMAEKMSSRPGNVEKNSVIFGSLLFGATVFNHSFFKSEHKQRSEEEMNCPDQSKNLDIL